ncbi:hypothetical protein H9W91_17355 [Streptomyces alfalfae]|uniref:hypothetical protein n=1 Tax=Streptomyces alfalfae TaxID=1642299 RepID=UPI001BA8E63D|nr:hypothetical protein [Streptomyces alfalfae]QUI32430.1 hypothetical protein H9W91_17355 [Streptomyces alfalfae]
MAFPSTPLDIRTELHIGGAWTDRSGDIYVRDPKDIDVGRRDQGARTDPGRLSLTINNRDGTYCPRNPMSPLYGLIGRNTRVRVSVPGTTRYLELPGSTDAAATTPDDAVLDITGDLDLRWEGEADWYAPGARVLIGKWGEAGQRSYHLRLQDGGLYLQVIRGTTGSSPFAFAPLPALPPRAAVRAVLDADNGTGGWAMRHYWAPSLAGPWTEIGAGFTGTTPVAMAVSTAPLSIAPSDLTTTPPRRPYEGRVYAAEVRSGIDGPLVASPDFEAQPIGAADFTDGAGRLWTLAGAARISDRAERFVGEIAAWPQKWQPDGSDVWVPIEAAGILRRYGQGVKPLDSTLRRRIPSGNPIAYWPMEEEREATRAYSPIAGVSPAALTGVEFAAVDTLPSSKALPRLTAAATLSAIVPAHDAAGQWQVEFVYTADDKVPAASGPLAELINVSATGTVRRWVVRLRDGDGRLYGYDASGAAIVGKSLGIGGDVFHGWVRLALWVRDTGTGDIEYRIAWQDVGGDQGGRTYTLPGATAGQVTALTCDWGPLTEGWAIGHLSVLPTAASTLYTGSDNAYAGETAWQRMLRLANEESIPIGRLAGPLTPERVGPQRPDTLLDLLQSAADADGGLLLESRTRLGLLYRDRSTLYTQEPALTLDYRAPGLAAPLEPVDDDSATRNDITVTREGGSSARAVLEEGPLSVQPPPAGIGLYDEAVTLALDDDVQPVPHAFWRLHLGTYDGARYPSVSVMLHKAPHLIPAVLALREGDLIRLTNLPPWVSHNDVDLIVEGYHEVLDLQKWDITFNCSAGGPWNTAKADHPVYGKAGTDGSELAEPVDAAATTLLVAATAGPAWTTDPVEMPIRIDVGGEHMDVTGIADPVQDTYERTVSGGWGVADSGQTWTTSGGSASDYSVEGA